MRVIVSGLVSPSETSPMNVTVATAQLSASSVTTEGSGAGAVSQTSIFGGLLAVGGVVSTNATVKTSRCSKFTPSK